MRTLYLHLFNVLNLVIPSSRFHRLKVYILRKAGATIGNNVRILRGVNVSMGGGLVIGDNCHIGEFCSFLGGNADISIGSNVDIAPFVKFVTGSHKFDLTYKAAGTDVSSSIEISDGVWLCTNSTVLGGVNLGKSSVVAAQSLINKDVAPGVIVGGVPAKKLGLVYNAHK